MMVVKSPKCKLSMETTTTASPAEFTISLPYQTNPNGPGRWITSHVLRDWPLLIVSAIGALGNAAMASLIPIVTGAAFNAILQDPPQTGRVGELALILGASQLLRGFLQFVRNYGFEIIAQRIERNIRNELYVSLLGKSMTFHSLQPVGDTMARATNDVREINFLINPGINIVVGSLNFLLMPFIIAPTYHPALLLTPSLYLVFYVLAMWHYLHTLSPVSDKIRSTFGEMNTRLNEALDGIETVKGTAQEDTEIELFDKNAGRYRDALIAQGNLEARFLPMLLLFVALAGGLFHSLLLFQKGLLDTGQVVAYFGVLTMLGFPTFASIFAYSRVSLGLASARRILDLINRKNYLDQNTAGHSGTMKGEIEFRNVSFAYEDEKNNYPQDNEADASLHNISFKITPGQTVAIVGQTGSGKTTLARLINRTYDVTNGQLLVDGVDVREWNLETLRRGISTIEQDIFLFSRTVAANIAFGKPGATRDEVEAAARGAQAHEFIESFPEGYKTVIGERGMTLSGGQRQRLALARAFLTNPNILILDDSTSAIDSATEDKIQRAIYAAARGRTTLVITHRLSQIRWADMILVLRQGRLTAFGTHDDLMKNSKAYRRIFSN
jgi:ATP-binding cassette, subfamily B, bacterial